MFVKIAGVWLGKQDSSPRTWSGLYTEWSLGLHHKVRLELDEKEIAVVVESGECGKLALCSSFSPTCHPLLCLLETVKPGHQEEPLIQRLD